MEQKERMKYLLVFRSFTNGVRYCLYRLFIFLIVFTRRRNIITDKDQIVEQQSEVNVELGIFE